MVGTWKNKLGLEDSVYVEQSAMDEQENIKRSEQSSSKKLSPSTQLEIWSPTMERFLTLRVPKGKYKRGFLGYDPIHRKYKALCILEGKKVGILTLGGAQESWRIKPDGLPQHRPNATCGRCINGVVYYKAFLESHLKHAIVSFDVRSESWKNKLGFEDSVLYLYVEQSAMDKQEDIKRSKQSLSTTFSPSTQLEIWSPAMECFLAIRVPQGKYVRGFLGYDPIHGKFKALCILAGEKIGILTLGEAPESWRIISSGFPKHMPATACGRCINGDAENHKWSYTHIRPVKYFQNSNFSFEGITDAGDFIYIRRPLSSNEWAYVVYYDAKEDSIKAIKSRGNTNVVYYCIVYAS
ncbi:unnamed protein product [Thlaspi arvense]|uniref:F-box associated beta-propeller type 3 domain-containing protein n=1 Tax=Thlaspi arvense TaxID=13288 RepID=A0AAU9STA6_THLAR|nr:unnamed protein product [Thlaspi arvense]